MAEKPNMDQVGLNILQAARNELYLNLPYLDVVLCGLAFQPGGEMTLSMATDGEVLYYNSSFLAERYMRGRVVMNRAYPTRCGAVHNTNTPKSSAIVTDIAIP